MSAEPWGVSERKEGRGCSCQRAPGRTGTAVTEITASVGLGVITGLTGTATRLGTALKNRDLTGGLFQLKPEDGCLTPVRREAGRWKSERQCLTQEVQRSDLGAHLTRIFSEANIFTAWGFTKKYAPRRCRSAGQTLAQMAARPPRARSH